MPISSLPHMCLVLLLNTVIFVQEASKILCNVQVTLKLSLEYPPMQNIVEKGNFSF